MLESESRAWLEIDLSKVQHNIDEVHKLIPSTTKIMGIVKANAYGHGDVAVAKALQKAGVDFFGVSSVDEGIHLRENGIEDPILILGYTPPRHFHHVIENNLIQTFLSLEYAQKADKWCEENNVIMHGHCKIDTGMSRIGIICQDHEYHIEDVKKIYALPRLKVEGIFSHFSVSDYLDPNNAEFTRHQIKNFDRVIADLEKDGINVGLKHLQNSYGILNYPELKYDYVRPGLLFLGATCDDTIETKTHPDFWPIMQLKANVSLVKTIEPGVSVSYGRYFESTKPTRVATCSIGYADGYPRSVSNTGMEVLIHGQRAKIIGNICMDQMMIDVTDIPDVKEGDVITLFGQDGDAKLSVDELTRKAKTINNETFCFWSARVPRIYK